MHARKVAARGAGAHPPRGAPGVLVLVRPHMGHTTSSDTSGHTTHWLNSTSGTMRS